MAGFLGQEIYHFTHHRIGEGGSWNLGRPVSGYVWLMEAL